MGGGAEGGKGEFEGIRARPDQLSVAMGVDAVSDGLSSELMGK